MALIYRIFSNLVRPLISADGHFFEIWTIFCPLISNAGKVGNFRFSSYLVRQGSKFPLIIVGTDFSKQEKNKIC